MNFKLLVIILTSLIFCFNLVFAANEMNAVAKSNPATLEWLIVLNKNEIDSAKEVLKKKPIDPKVKQFAEFMISQHTSLLNNTLDLSKQLQEKPAHSKESKDLQNAGQKELADLKALDPEMIDKPYMNAMVKGFTEALAAINQYISNEQNASVKSLLVETQKHVSMHLEKAKQIQKELES